MTRYKCLSCLQTRVKLDETAELGPCLKCGAAPAWSAEIWTDNPEKIRAEQERIAAAPHVGSWRPYAD
jgi:hypothetical protein